MPSRDPRDAIEPGGPQVAGALIQLLLAILLITLTWDSVGDGDLHFASILAIALAMVALFPGLHPPRKSLGWSARGGWEQVLAVALAVTAVATLFIAYGRRGLLARGLLALAAVVAYSGAVPRWLRRPRPPGRADEDAAVENGSEITT